MSLGDLAQRLRTEPLQIEPILDRLVEMDWAARLDEAGAQRHVLLCEPAATPASPLVAALLLDPCSDVGRFWQCAGFEAMTLKDVLDA